MREGMGAGGSDLEALVSGDLCQLAAKLNNLLARRSGVGANLRAQLHDRLMHLGLRVLFQNHLTVGKNLLDVRAQLARLWINDLEFFFDPEGEDVIVRTH